MIWAALNFVVAAAGIDALIEDDREKRIALTIALPAIAFTTDGDQSNLLVAGAFLLAFRAFERGQSAGAASLVAGSAFVKLFPIVGAVFALLHPRRGRSVMLLAGAALVLVLLPLAVCSPGELLAQYQSWSRLGSHDQREPRVVGASGAPRSASFLLVEPHHPSRGSRGASAPDRLWRALRDRPRVAPRAPRSSPRC